MKNQDQTTTKEISNNMEEIYSDIRTASGLLRMFDEAMDEELQGLIENASDNAFVSLSHRRYYNTISAALGAARDLLQRTESRIGDI